MLLKYVLVGLEFAIYIFILNTLSNIIIPLLCLWYKKEYF